MAIEIVTLKLSEIEGITIWTVLLDDVPAVMNGKQRQFTVSGGVPHVIRLDYSGNPGGKMNVDLFHKGKVIGERKPTRIPNDSTASWDRFPFTVGEVS